MHVTVTRHGLDVSPEGKKHNKEDHTKDTDQDPGGCRAPRAAVQGWPAPRVSDAGGGLVLAFLLCASSSLYSSIGPMREDGGKEARVEEMSTEGQGEV